MAKEYEIDVKLLDSVVHCPIQGKTFVVSVGESCKKCDFLLEITEKDSEEMIPAKVHCRVPADYYNVIISFNKVDCSTIREKKEG